MKVDGECLCGACTFTAEVDPGRVVLCHCDDCQRQSGCAFRTIALVDRASFRLGKGRLQTWVKTSESGAKRVLAFCPDCGTHVYGAPPEGQPGPMSLRVGALAQREALPPMGQVWCRSRLDWLDGVNDLPRFATQPGAPAGGDGA